MIHLILLIGSLLFWQNMFLKYWIKNNLKTENSLAIINNFQLFVLLSLGFYFTSFEINTLNDDKKINILISLSLYLSLVYNIIDSIVQFWRKRYAFVLHHISILPFIYGYLFSGYFYNLQIIYTFLELSSISYNCRYIYPSWNKFHPYFYFMIRSVCTPWFVYKYFLEVSHLPFYLFLTSSMSVFLLTIFNVVSIKIILKL
jgi:hypothetical protein